MEKFVVSARKYRPATFDSVVGQSSITTTLKNAIKSNHIGHAYLFCGPRGVGKTTCARIFAKTLNCLSPDENTEPCNECSSCKAFNESRSFNIHELDAASNNKVEDIRSLIDQVRIPPQLGKFSIYIIDEVHMLSASAFNAFLKTLEEPPQHAIFVLATTEKHKIIPTILSRCQVFDFNRITVEDTVKYLESIAQKEQISVEQDALNIIAQKADGAMRDALTIFDQMASFSGNQITYREVINNLNVLDYEYYFKLTNAFLDGNVAEVLLVFDDILREGFDAHNFINGLSKHFRDLLVCRDQQTIRLLEVGNSIKEYYREQSARTSPEFLFKCLQIASECDLSFKSSNNQRLLTELALIQMCTVSGEKKKSSDNNVNSTVTPPEEKKNDTKIEITNNHKINNTEKTSPEIVATEPAYKAKKSVSIKDTLKEIGKPVELNIEVKPEKTDINIDLQVNDQPLLEGEVKNRWDILADSIKEEMPRMYSALRNQYPVIKDGNILELTFSNPTQADDFNMRIKPAWILVIRTELKNSKAEFRVNIIEDEEDTNKKPYTAEDRYKHMLQKNPTLSKLKQEFNLDFE